MGDNLSNPNFTHSYQLLVYLIKSCITEGIVYVKKYSPLSENQTEDKRIILPFNEFKNLISEIPFEEMVTGSFMSN